MGLDVVELVMEVEDHFGVVIWDDEYEGLRTVGDLHALLNPSKFSRRRGSSKILLRGELCELASQRKSYQ